LNVFSCQSLDYLSCLFDSEYEQVDTLAISDQAYHLRGVCRMIGWNKLANCINEMRQVIYGQSHSAKQDQEEADNPVSHSLEDLYRSAKTEFETVEKLLKGFYKLKWHTPGLRV
jgi:hypothetical protein